MTDAPLPPTSPPPLDSPSLPTAEPTYLQRLRHLGGFIILLWVIEIADRLFFQSSLQNHGIHPRSFSHLQGFLFAPFLHAGWGHLFGNSTSLLILGAAILARGWRDLALVSVVSALTAGILIWIIGQTDSNHIGASSLVFGYLGFLLASGFYQRTPLTIIFAILVIIFYGGAIFGILPTESIRAANISWQAHLGGAIGGILVARQKKLKLASHSDLTA